jgi:hypothetical protein
VRDFRASIEQTVAESLRAIPDFDVARAIREAQHPPRRGWRGFWRRLGRP